MRSNTKQALLVTLVGVTLFVALLRLSDVLAFAAQLVDLVLPILAGGILALFLSVPMAGLEKRLGRLFAKARKQPSGKALHLLSFLLTLLGVVLVLVLALTLLIPELVQSFHSLYLQIEANIPRWTAYLHAQDPDMGWLMSRLEGIDWEQLLHKVTSGLDTVLVNAAGAVSATVNLVVTASFALIISVYLSLGAQSLGHQARTLVRAYLKPGHAAWVLKFCRLFRQSFANFLTGQCSEAVILGMLMSLAFSLFRIPYGSLVGLFTAICAIIPYVGALLSCVISVLLVLLVDPLLAADANDVYSVISHQDNAVDLYTMYGGFLFLGVFLGLLFLLSTVLIIYYKQISEGYEDQRRYQIMQQVGMSPREVRSSIRSQVLLVFFLPLVTAGIHVAAAFPMLCKLLELFNLFDVRLFALCAAGTLLVFCAIYALVYGLTTRTYSRIVGGQ